MSLTRKLTTRTTGGVAAAALILAASLACTEPTRTSYPMRTTFDFGNVRMSVDSTESTSDINKKAIIVHATVNNFDGDAQARVASQSWNQWFKLADKDGKKYRCVRFQPTDMYYQGFSDGGHRAWASKNEREDYFATLPSSWVMHFDVNGDADGFTLLINNMSFHQGSQPVAIAVPLDR